MTPSRTITWEDPVSAAEAAAGMSGLEGARGDAATAAFPPRPWPS